MQPGPHPSIPGESKTRDNRLALTRTETATDRNTTCVDPTSISTLSRGLGPPQQRGAAALSRPTGATSGIPAGARGGASTPAVKSTARYELEDHRAVTSAAASGAARVASAEPSSASAPASAPAQASPTVTWPVPLGPVSAGVQISAAAALPSAVGAKSTAPPDDGREECKEATPEAGMKPGRYCGLTESESTITEDEKDRVAKQGSGPMRSSALLRTGGVRREGYAMRATPREVAYSGPPSSSAGFPSMQAMSAFSAASLCSSYNDESSWYGAPVETVRSPASYFDSKG